MGKRPIVAFCYNVVRALRHYLYLENVKIVKASIRQQVSHTILQCIFQGAVIWHVISQVASSFFGFGETTRKTMSEKSKAKKAMLAMVAIVLGLQKSILVVWLKRMESDGKLDDGKQNLMILTLRSLKHTLKKINSWAGRSAVLEETLQLLLLLHYD